MKKTIFKRIHKTYEHFANKVEKSNVLEVVNKNWVYLLTLVAFLGIGVGIGYMWYQNEVLFQEKLVLQNKEIILSSAYTRTNISLKETQKELSKYKEDLQTTEVQRDVLAQNLGQEKTKVANQEKEIDTLEKLTTLDPELLEKYSKVFFLNENYVPPQLFPVPNQYKYYEDREVNIHANVWPYLQGLLLRAKKEDVTLYALSSYRSFDEQANLKSRYKITYGAGTANQFSADQGYSEHQLGTTVDFITTGLGGQLYGFENTKSYEWLEKNAYEYGFVLSYPKKNNYYVFEPWHWRFVGIKLATTLHKQGKFFYDLSQREIDEYLLYIFD